MNNNINNLELFYILIKININNNIELSHIIIKINIYINF